MARLPEIGPEKLSAEQRSIYDRMMRERGHMRGPFAVWLRNAELCEHTLKLQEMFASRVQLERRVLELMILVAARTATAQYAWFIHEPHARKFGIASEIIEAIRERRTLDFKRDGNLRRTSSRGAGWRCRLLLHGGNDPQRLRCQRTRGRKASRLNLGSPLPRGCRAM